MSELINRNKYFGELRWQLLVTASAAALIGASCISGVEAAGDDVDRPTVWIELGGQLERVDSTHSVFAPAFFDAAQPQLLTPMVNSQKPPAYGFGGEGKVTFAPDSSDWVFSAAVRYGRSNGTRHLHQQSLEPTPSGILRQVAPGVVPPTSKLFFGDGQTEFHESHYVLDFQAGRDVGLGLFGAGSSSVVSAGVRFAQFTSSTDVTLHARPYLHLSHTIKYKSFPNKYNRHTADYTAVLQASRSTRAIGPSLSWDASVSLARPGERSTIDLDWGINGSILFGRQKIRMHHQTSLNRYDFKFFESDYAYGPHYLHTAQHADRNQSRSVTIPNIGGFAGISLKFPNAKVALGYRADFFLGAMDSGIDTAKKTNVGFYGPFATISVGLGG